MSAAITVSGMSRRPRTCVPRATRGCVSPCRGSTPLRDMGQRLPRVGSPTGRPGRAAPCSKLLAPTGAGRWHWAQSCGLKSRLVMKPALTPEALEGLRGPENRSQRHQGSVPQLLPAPRHLAGLLGTAGRASPAKPSCTSSARLSQQQHPEVFGQLLPREPGSRSGTVQSPIFETMHDFKPLGFYLFLMCLLSKR